MSLLQNWTNDSVAALGDQVVSAQHTVADSSLFREERLFRLFAEHPDARLFIHAMGTDPRKSHELSRGEASNRSPEELWEAVKAGRLWLNIVGLQRHRDYRDLIDALYEELEERTAGLRTFARAANLLISSPSAMVYYHADAPLNILWHMRGRKRVWVYPVQERFVSQQDLEDIFSGTITEDLPYDPGFDAAAQVLDLAPGDVVTWPQNAPHRVQNLEGVNVSMSTEHFTREARRRQQVYCANRVLRQLRLPVGSTRLRGPVPAAKAFAFRAVRKAGMLPWKRYEYQTTFEV